VVRAGEVRLLEVDFIDDGPDKPVGIFNFIGRVPILAFGNSDGDKEMLEWTAAGKGVRFAGIVHHTDAEREYAYDRESHFGRLAKALDEGQSRGWSIADMKADWKIVYPLLSQPGGSQLHSNLTHCPPARSAARVPARSIHTVHSPGMDRDGTPRESKSTGPP